MEYAILVRTRIIVRLVLARCAAVTIVSSSWRVALKRQFETKPSIYVVTNGFDRDESSRVRPYEFDHPAIGKPHG